MSVFKINLPDALELMDNFLSDESLWNIATNKSFGGLIKKSSFEKRAIPYDGTLCWFCWNPDRLYGAPYFFLSFENADEAYDTDSDPPPTPVTETLYYSKASFKYNKTTRFQLMEFLFGQYGLDGITEDSLTDAQVALLATNFKNLVKNQDEIKCNRTPMGFFEQNEGVQFFLEFLNDNNYDYIRYFWGYDSTKDNKIRIILIGVDSSGRNQLPPITDLDPTILMLERSWPPY